MPLEETARLRQNHVTGGVTRPPALHSIVRLQRIVGNRAAQRILEIGDGRPQHTAGPGAAAEPAESKASVPWSFSIAVGVLVGLLAAAISVAAGMRPNPMAAIVAGSSIGAALISGFLKSRRQAHYPRAVEAKTGR